MLKSLLVNIIGGIIGVIVFLGFMYLLGLILQIMETYPIFAILLGIFDFIWIFREVSK